MADISNNKQFGYVLRWVGKLALNCKTSIFRLFWPSKLPYKQCLLTLHQRGGGIASAVVLALIWLCYSNITDQPTITNQPTNQPTNQSTNQTPKSGVPFLKQHFCRQGLPLAASQYMQTVRASACLGSGGCQFNINFCSKANNWTISKKTAYSSPHIPRNPTQLSIVSSMLCCTGSDKQLGRGACMRYWGYIGLFHSMQDLIVYLIWQTYKSSMLSSDLYNVNSCYVAHYLWTKALALWCR